MGLNPDQFKGQTPLDEDEKEGLLIPTISTREELDEFEQQNIEEALQWVLSGSFMAESVISEKFICSLHKRMFGSVWKWAGTYRKSNKNLGIDKWQIPEALKILCDDTICLIQNQTFNQEEIAIRFKHRIVCIHCFPNGNGRHSRLMADIIINKVFKRPLFSWGTGNISQQGDIRKQYIDALKIADQNNFDPLLKFARS